MQLLVEKNKNLDFKEALELAADVQPIKVNPQVIDDVSSFLCINFNLQLLLLSLFIFILGLKADCQHCLGTSICHSKIRAISGMYYVQYN